MRATRTSKNIIFTIGDFSAKIGSNNQGYEEIMGKQGFREINENGERFANLCASTSGTQQHKPTNTNGYKRLPGCPQT